MGRILSTLEEVGVPISFTDGLKEIYFTLLRGDEDYKQVYGDYKDGVIRLSVDPESREELVETFVHELGHHMDERYDISARKKIVEEKKKASRLMPDSYARKDVDEYVACGFEVYYFGSRRQRGDFRRNNPKLYNAIRYLERNHD